jgi:TusA-related sulfurtransferase
MNFVKAKVALEGVPVGETLDFLLDGGDPVRNVPASFIEQGQDVLGVTAEQSHFRVRVRRAK